jgi:glycosyltransferase involved in cell wall biosynthesis
MRLLEKLGFRKKPENDLIILDDIFPHLLSSFRVAEFNAYLSAYEKAVVYSTATSFSAIGETRSFPEVTREYEIRYPELAGRTFKVDSQTRLNGQLAYFVFLQNAWAFMDRLKSSNIPFIFTLYPGGGFRIDEPVSDDTLRRVCSLPNLRKIITTQKLSQEYLLKKGLLEPEKIEFIYGGVFPSEELTNTAQSRTYHKDGKDTFDICFVAFKYMARGIDKGYDVFVQVARELSRLYDDIRFHVVGPYDESDIEVSDLKGKIAFYGVKRTDFFPAFYSKMDIILSPNVPFTLMPGTFDGFPTGGCIEAALCGVAVFCTDVLNQNVVFKDGEEIVIIPRSVEDICELIAKYYNHYDRLVELGCRGQEAFKAAFAIETQLEKRLNLMSQYLPQN